MSRGVRGLNVVLVLAAATLVAVGVTSVGNPNSTRATIRTAAVQRGDVQATVSTTGNVSAPTNLSLNFTTGGRVTEVDVKPGDRVTANQVLARVDDSSQRAALASAQAALNAAQQRLFQAQHPVSDAQAAVDAIAAKQAADAVTNAQTALADEQNLAAINATVLQNAVNSATAQLQTDQSQLQTDQNQLQADQARQQQDQSSGSAAQQQADAQAVSSDNQKVNNDNQTVAKDQNALTSAQTAQTQGLARDQQSLHQAQAALVSAQNSQQATLANAALKAAPLQPGDLAGDQAAIASAQTTLTNAQTAEDGTSLTAPTSGTVAAVNAQLGQTVGGGGTTASSSAGTTGASGSGSTGSGSSSGQPVVTLIDLGTLQVKAGFSETDAARVTVDQPATVTFPALPSLQLAAHVVAIDTTSTVVSNVVTYNATMELDNPAPQVKPGMSANVSVVVSKADNVLHVPAAAVRGGGATAVITLVKAGKQSPVTVTVGVRGDDSTEIDSGLSEGDVVMVSSGQTGTTTGGATVRGVGGFGGGGLGGLGGAVRGG